MQRTVYSILALLITWSTGVSQDSRGFVASGRINAPDHHYQDEYTLDSSADPQKWLKAGKGLNAAFGSTDQLYFRTEVPQLAGSATTFEQTAWKGERVNSQIVVWSPDTIGQIRFVTGDLSDGKGNAIKKENITFSLIRYVLSNYPYAATNTNCDVAPGDSLYLLPDRFESFERFDLPGGTVRPVWVSVNIPRQTVAGTYSGKIEVQSETGMVPLDLKITVQGQVLPAPHDWKFRLDLWQNPWVVAYYYQLEPWSEEHKALLKKHLKLYAEAGGKYITTYAVHSPWSDNSYMLEGAMIDWRKGKDGKWKFDYSIFDEYVSLAMETGVDEAITIYTPVPWGHRFRYLDENSGNYVYEEWSPDSRVFREVWNVFLTDLKAHLEKKGWFRKTYLGINENPLDITIAAIKVIKDHSKEWRITYAGDWHAELSALLDDYSPVISHEAPPAAMKERTSRGQTTTYYVCCTPNKPNNFVFSPPAESTYIGWYSAAYGYDGFLRWAYDAWPEDPSRDARHTLWPAGDCFLVYPGGNSSIRFERLREGIVDYEKIRILREKAGTSSDKKVKASLVALDNHLKRFIDDPDYARRDYSLSKVTGLLKEGKALVRQLSNDMAGK